MTEWALRFKTFSDVNWHFLKHFFHKRRERRLSNIYSKFTNKLRRNRRSPELFANFWHFRGRFSFLMPENSIFMGSDEQVMKNSHFQTAKTARTTFSPWREALILNIAPPGLRKCNGKNVRRVFYLLLLQWSFLSRYTTFLKSIVRPNLQVWFVFHQIRWLRTNLYN